MRSYITKFGIVAAVLVALALSGELLLRVFAPVGFLAPAKLAAQAGGDWGNLIHVATQRAVPTYELAAGIDRDVRGYRVRTNSLGMRDDEPLARDEPGVVRIAVLGDSMTFGVGVQQGEDFPAQLERELNASAEPGQRFDALNFGVSGYSTIDECAALRDKALPLDPDVVVLAYCLNDPDALPIQPLCAHFAPVRWWQHSHALRWIANRAHGRSIRKYGGGDIWRCVHNPDGPYWGATAAALDEMRDLCRARDVRVLVAILPMLWNGAPWSAYSYGDLHAFVAAQATARGFEVLDMASALTEHDPATLTLAPDDAHFNALGNRLVARALARALRERGLLTPH